jgi:hypothetical protein
MMGIRGWLSTGVMLVTAVQGSAAILPRPLAAPAGTTQAPPQLRVFGSPSIATPGKLDGALREISGRYPSLSSAHLIRDLHQINPAARFRLSTPTTTPQVLVDAVTTGNPLALKSSLESLGLQDAAVFANDVGGWLPVDQLTQAEALAELHFVRAAMPRTRSSVVATQGDFAQQSAAVRSTYPALTGAGVTVGVLSDSFNCLATYEQAGSGVPASGYNGYAPWGFTATYSTDQQPATGQAASTSALPAGVNVVKEATCMNYGAPYQTPFGDEGRAILQIIHAIAPGAGLAFYTAVNSEADFANGIKNLASAGAKVIDDDVGYPDEPFFQDGLIAQAINTVAAQGVVYFSSAGNDGINSYTNTAPSFPVAGTGQQSNERLLNFDTTGATTTTSLTLSIPALYPGDFIYLVVGWDQPYVTGSPGSGGSTSSIEMCVSGAGTDLVTDNNSYPNTVSCSGASTPGQDPVQYLIIGNPANATGQSSAATVSLTVGLVNGTPAPGRIKFQLSDNGAGAKITNAFATGGPTIQGHAMAATAAAVGAAFYWLTPQCGASQATLHGYSSQGGDPILFDTSGQRLAVAQVREKPDFVGPDGANNTVLGATLDQSQNQYATAINQTSITGCADNEAFPNFFGTSASAPHAAAAAALILQANAGLTNTQILDALRNSALPMTARSTNPAATYNYDDGHGFLDVNAAIQQLPAAAPAISVSPTSVAVGSSATLTWNAVNSSGCTASGSWSGSQSASGTQTVTPTAAGTNTYTLSCATASGNMSSSATLTVTAAASSGGGHGGGALDVLTLLWLGGVLLACWGRRARVRLVA